MSDHSSEPPHPESDSYYSLEVAAEITGLKQQVILHYREIGLLPAHPDHPDQPILDDQGLHRLRHIAWLRRECEMNTRALQVTLQLIEEVELLRAELR